MSRYFSYLNSAKEILGLYNGKEPFSLFIKEHFRQHKKFGSKDRKLVSHLCYCYFRTGKLFIERTTEEKIITSLFLCSDEKNELLENLDAALNERVTESLKDKWSEVNSQQSIENIFSWADELSDGIEKDQFILSHLQQPDLFIRIRPGNKLQIENGEWRMENETCIRLPNSTKIDEVLELNKEAVVQDYSSQRISEFLQIIKEQFSILPVRTGTGGHSPFSISLWDCCAASGGKSILAKDVLGDIDLTVSDIRENILINLKKRFKEAGIEKYHSLVIDLSKSGVKGQKSKQFSPSDQVSRAGIPHSPFSIIIADVPCSGSGTWARTPEQLLYFKQEEIERYHSLQQKIVSNAITHLKKDGYFLYITCSVFKKENEDNVEFIKKEFHLELVKMEFLKGYSMKADTMFAALFKKIG